MRHTALTAMLATMLLPAASSAVEARTLSAHTPAIPIALSPTTEVFMTFDTWRFDGAWYVVVFCPESNGAPAYAYRFGARVKDGALHGERGDAGTRGWMTLDGTIQPDGIARLKAVGITNDADEVLGRASTETPYAYHVLARFEGSHGRGGRIEGRICNLSFTRQ